MKINQYMPVIVTHECRRECSFCLDPFRGRKEFTSMDKIEKFIYFAKSKNIKTIGLTGGEATEHPRIVQIAERVKEHNLDCALTTNYDNPDVIKNLDGIVDRFNISFYDQENLPDVADYQSEIYLDTIIHKERFAEKKDLDLFIDEYMGQFTKLRFSTLVSVNEWTSEHQIVPFLEKIEGEELVLHGGVKAQKYRGHIIKRYDKGVERSGLTTYHGHVDGRIAEDFKRELR
jgi:organic radical activating enzyme